MTDIIKPELNFGINHNSGPKAPIDYDMFGSSDGGPSVASFHPSVDTGMQFTTHNGGVIYNPDPNIYLDGLKKAEEARRRAAQATEKAAPRPAETSSVVLELPVASPAHRFKWLSALTHIF